MRPRSLLFPVLLLVLTTAATASPRRRSVRVPSSDCQFELAPVFTNPISQGGMVRGPVRVTPNAASCTSWPVYSPVDWIHIEVEPSFAYVTVTPNASPFARTATIYIASERLEITQIGMPTVADPGNLLRNATFNTDLSDWGWQARFPNGTGDASWSPLDANGNPFSGSIRLRDDLASPLAFQQLQCINTAPGVYDYGLAVRAESREAVQAIIAFFEYPAADCEGSFARYATKTIQVAQPGVWERRTYLDRLSTGRRSILIVIAAWAQQDGLQEVWLDDVFVKPR